MEEWLRLVERTRLFCNTMEELGQLVGFSVGNRNSLARKGGQSLFMKEAIFHQLCYLCAERTGLNLRETVEAYQDVDRFVDRYQSLLRGKETLARIVHLFYGGEADTEDLDFAKKKLEAGHVPLLVLMMLGCLPRLSARNGDVKDIKALYDRTMKFLNKVCQVPTMQKLPALGVAEDFEGEEPEELNRLDLIARVRNVLVAYGAISTHQRLSGTNRELMKEHFIPEIEGVWTENDASTTFWYFQRLDNGYFMYHYILKSERKELCYTKYSIFFFCKDEDPMAMVVHPRTMHHVVAGRPVPQGLYAYLDFTQSADCMLFEPRDKGSEWFRVRRFRRSKHARSFEMMREDRAWKKVNEFAEDEYELHSDMTAITQNYIYLQRDEKSLYKVPKALNDVLTDIHFGDSVGVMRFANATYLAFDEMSLYYNVTTEEEMKRAGIEVVDNQHIS